MFTVITMQRLRRRAAAVLTMQSLRRRAAAAVSIACCAAIALAPAAHSHGRALLARSTPLGGVNVGISSGMSRSEIDRDVAAAHSLHAKLIRVAIAWSAFEPQARGQISAAATAAADRLMHDAAGAHIEVIAVVLGTPCWASALAKPSKRCVPGRQSEANAYPPREASAYGAFVGWLVKRYGPQLAAIEVWNEPDQANQDYLAGPEKPRHYAELLRAAYPAVKHADPTVKVLAGSLVGSNGAFMNALYEEGVKGYYDGVAVHFYTLTLASLRVFREDQLAHHDYKPLWLDEFGWSSCWPRHRIEQEQGCVTKQVQAQNITSSFREVAHTPYVAAMLTYDLRDARGEDFGVLTRSGARKPSFDALANVLRSPAGGPIPVRLRLQVRNRQVIASGSAPVGDYMKLEAFENGRLRYRALFTLDRFNRYSIELPRVLGTHGLTVRVYQYWLGPQKDAQSSI